MGVAYYCGASRCLGHLDDPDGRCAPNLRPHLTYPVTSWTELRRRYIARRRRRRALVLLLAAALVVALLLMR